MSKGFTKKQRQEIIDGYLNDSGQNSFRPEQFLDWLVDNPDHVAYAWFHGESDEEAARQYRIDKARDFVSGLRIEIRVSTAPSKSKKIRIVTHEDPLHVPRYISRLADRSNGGGYVEVDINDPVDQRELARQAAMHLRSWMKRWGGTAELIGVDASEIEKIAGEFDFFADAAKAA